MDTVYMMNGLKVIELSKIIDPATETRRCKLHRFNTGGAIPDFHTNFDIMSHLGTHCECPYHHDENWPDVTALPLTSFFGRCVYVNFVDAEPCEYVTPAMLDLYGSKVREGDVVIIDSPFRIPPFTPLTNSDADKRLRVNGGSAEWFVQHKVKCVGFGDGVSIESINDDVKPFHDVCMAKNILFIEVLKNLEQLTRDVFFISYSPLPIKGLDSSPVRAYAIEGLAEFSE